MLMAVPLSQAQSGLMQPRLSRQAKPMLKGLTMHLPRMLAYGQTIVQET